MPAKKNQLNWLSVILTVSISLSLLTGCSSAGEKTAQTAATTAQPVASNGTSGPAGQPSPGSLISPPPGAGANDHAISVIKVDYTDAELDADFSVVESTRITLNGTSVQVSGTGATVSGTEVVIDTAGTYLITGTLTDGRILVNASDKDVVRLVLNNADIVSKSGSPIQVMAAKKAILIVADRTENKITDESAHEQADEDSADPNAAIFSKADLTINGQGSLSVEAKHAHGIVSKDELKIISGALHVITSGDGLKGKDLVGIKGGTITIDAEGDGIQSSNSGDKKKGNIVVEGGSITIDAGLDGLQAERTIQVSDGHLTIMTGGGSDKGTQSNPLPGMGFRPGVSGQATTAAASNETSKKGMKAQESILVLDGTIAIDSADDALHANAFITINGGDLTLASGDDGIHADTSIVINEGHLAITKSFEGIESARVALNGGIVRVAARDDGINIAGGAYDSSIGGRPGQNTFSTGSDNRLVITGGNTYISALGDGVDANGPITMSNGTLIIDGPTENNNGALDFTSFQITGGLLVAAGSAGMAMAPDAPSTQNTIMVNFTTPFSADTLVNVTATAGDSVITFAPQKSFQSFVISSPFLETGASYVISTGGHSTGTATNGLYSDGQYQNGTPVATVAISSVLTRYGTAGGGGMGGRPSGPGGRR